MNPFKFPARRFLPFKSTLLGLAISGAAVNLLSAQTANPIPLLQIKADQVTAKVSPTKLFGGEWATRVGSPTPNLAGALGDATWMCCLERNADIVMMHCYAPLFMNVSKLNGVKSGSSKGTAIVLQAKNRNETNSLQDPKHVVPVTENTKGLGASFTRTFPSCSITILELKTK